MSMFVSKLTARLIDSQAAQGRGRWELTEPLVYRSDIVSSMKTVRDIEVPAGFVTDFASVPRLPFLFTLLGGKAHEAAVVHDYLYEKQKYRRITSDRIFREAAKVCGCTKWECTFLYLGVRLGGWFAWRKKYLAKKHID